LSNERNERLAKLQELKQLRTEYRLLSYQPYPKQREFHHLKSRERALLAGNQLGKTMSAGMETAMHLTGLYPDWWEGRRFRHPVRWGVGSETGDLLKKGPQRMLLGDHPAVFGNGTIPKPLVHDWKMARGIPDGVDSVQIRYCRDGIATNELSEAVFLSYAEGRAKWASDTWHGAWLDEEPEHYDVYTEALTRTNRFMGPIMFTATPMRGFSDVVRRFLQHDGDTDYVTMTVYDAEHFTAMSAADQKRWLEQYPEREQRARLSGEPMLGEGAIFKTDEEVIKVAPFSIPSHWAIIGGLDFGIDHPFAAVKVAHDRDTDTVYVTNLYRQRGLTPIGHASALRHWGAIPWAWPHDGLQRDKQSGKQLAQFYREEGLSLITEHAQYPDNRGNGLWASIEDINQRIQSGRFKVFANLSPWFEEYRFYHMDEGMPVPEHDDLLSATRYAVMMLRYAQAQEELPKSERYRIQKHVRRHWMAA
jgi:phage terminase large subunit-like protein